MARKKKFPSVVIEYESLSDVLKSLHDKTIRELGDKDIKKLREEAKEMGVESPTTLCKDDLIKRMADRVISQYLPPDFSKKDSSAIAASYDESSEKVKGIFESFNGNYYIGNVLVPQAVAKEAKLREGDMVEGIVSQNGGVKTLAVVNNVDGESKTVQREHFADKAAAPRREFGSMIAGSLLERLMPDLQMGERVILSNLSIDETTEITKGLPLCIGLYMGVSPEEQSLIPPPCFVAPFDCAKEESLKIAHLALNRAKRLSERGKDVLLVVYGFDSIFDRDTERAIFGAGRCFVKGSLTVIADVSKEKDSGIYAKIATRII